MKTYGFGYGSKREKMFKDLYSGKLEDIIFFDKESKDRFTKLIGETIKIINSINAKYITFTINSVSVVSTNEDNLQYDPSSKYSPNEVIEVRISNLEKFERPDYNEMSKSVGKIKIHANVKDDFHCLILDNDGNAIREYNGYGFNPFSFRYDGMEVSPTGQILNWNLEEILAQSHNDDPIIEDDKEDEV